MKFDVDMRWEDDDRAISLRVQDGMGTVYRLDRAHLSSLASWLEETLADAYKSGTEAAQLDIQRAIGLPSHL